MIRFNFFGLAFCGCFIPIGSSEERNSELFGHKIVGHALIMDTFYSLNDHRDIISSYQFHNHCKKCAFEINSQNAEHIKFEDWSRMLVALNVNGTATTSLVCEIGTDFPILSSTSVKWLSYNGRRTMGVRSSLALRSNRLHGKKIYWNFEIESENQMWIQNLMKFWLKFIWF